MARDDLSTLSDDDLTRLSNRGKFNAARKELGDGRLAGTLREQDGNVSVTWSDGKVTEVPAGIALSKGKCACIEPGVCKHLIALVLLYQQSSKADELSPASEPWDPGRIGDDVLARDCRTQILTIARQLLDAGVLAELSRGTQPLARFHLPVCTVRFLVPGSLGYARCNCARTAPCEHVALAVWAFRLLPQNECAGIVTAGNCTAEVPADLRDAIDSVLLDFAEQGVSTAGKGMIDRLGRLANTCDAAALVWPGELIQEWVAQLDCYNRHDARFDPVQIATLVGEIAARMDALSGTSLPSLLVRGGESDRAADLELGEYWGLGSAIRPGRRGVALTAYLYDRKAGSVVAITSDVDESSRAEERLASMGELGERSAIHGLNGGTFRAVGAGVLTSASGRRTARHELIPGRERKGRPGPALAAQERLAWEEIEPPVYVEDFGVLQERLGQLPPSCLRPRRIAEDFHVLRVATVESHRFDHITHTVQAVLSDARGTRALLEHPFTTRGQAGVEALMSRLGTGVRFVSGGVRQTARGLIVRPVGLVCQDGDKRSLIQPWIERASGGRELPSLPTPPDAGRDWLARLNEQLGELFVTGLGRADHLSARTWAELAQSGAVLGCVRLAAKAKALAQALDHKTHTLDWGLRAAAGVVLELAVLARLAGDVA